MTAKVLATESTVRDDEVKGSMYWFESKLVPHLPSMVRCLKTKKVYVIGVVPQATTTERQYVILLGRSKNIRLETEVFARLLSQDLFEIVHHR